MVNLGIIGVSEGNGHPYSFSAIINGYNKDAMKDSGWIGILNYLNLKDESDFLINKAIVTHIWTQNLNDSIMIANATFIENICDNFEDMIGKVDAVIIARDDYETHFLYAKPFLENGIKVFIDKPLSLNIEELKFFLPYLKNNQLMSCSGLRYAKELDSIRSNIKNFINIKLIRGTVLNSWEKYGIHMLDGIFNVIEFDVKSVLSVHGKHMSVILKNYDESIIQIDALESTVKTFQFDFWCENEKFTAEVEDNFTAFKRTLFYFLKLIETGISDINANLTINLMKTLIAARISVNEKREVYLDEINI